VFTGINSDGTQDMDFDLKGKHVVVTGGTSGIGHGIVLGLIDQGVNVTTCYTRENEAVEILAKEAAAQQARVTLVRADIRDQGQVDQLFATAVETNGPISGLVNNAGVISHHPIAELEADEWLRIIDTNVSGMYRTVRSALPNLTDDASIVNISSGVGLAGMPNAAHYVTSKAAILGFTRGMAKELGPRGIRVNAITSGIIDGTGQRSPAGDAAKPIYIGMTSLKRLGDPSDIADVVLFLVSRASRYVSGSFVAVDGGI
jgi:3-oxoacyl-[acyl-carrier protein] reductase